jgi:hypothetical protein
LVFGSLKRTLGNSLLLLYLFLYYSSSSSFAMNMTLVYSIILDTTLLYLIMFSIILFLVYFDYILGIVRTELYLSIGSYSACSLISWVSGKHCVGVVPIPYLPSIAPYISDRVVHHKSDSPVESFVVHLPSIGQAEHSYYREVTTMFYIFLSNITMCIYNLFLP